MKRSKHVVLASMRKSWRPLTFTPVTVVIASAVLTGCSDNEQDASIYQSLDDCIDENPNYSAECQSAYQYAVQEASRTGPKYQSQNDCEAEFGNDACVQPRGNSWFMPAMTGFMFGRMMNSNNYYSQPMYRSSYPGSIFYDRWTTADGRDYGSSRYKNTKVKVNRDQMKPKPTVNRTISRGGFGSTVSAKSSWGSSRSSSGSKGWGG
ncbi:DUF1190 family protein [Photobacterium makurazakiensis]|uniref:DUF1190 family protein n=1 Tax=Photobacterium makurazakiensis TaxID=2910234 RepID=UPI003D0D43D2